MKSGSEPFLLRVAHKERKLDYRGFSSSAVGMAREVPVCKRVGTKAEGWYRDGVVVRSGRCSHQVLRCQAIGSRSEGWYANRKERFGRIQRTRCSSGATKPVCKFMGTSAEGWYKNGHAIKNQNCEGQVAECGAIGSRSEGWYAASYTPVGLVAYAQCS